MPSGNMAAKFYIFSSAKTYRTPVQNLLDKRGGGCYNTLRQQSRTIVFVLTSGHFAAVVNKESCVFSQRTLLICVDGNILSTLCILQLWRCYPLAARNFPSTNRFMTRNCALSIPTELSLASCPQRRLCRKPMTKIWIW